MDRRKSQITTEILLESYQRLGNIWKVGDEVGLCGQSVHERLKKAGVKLKNKPFSDEEKKRLQDDYESYVSSGKLLDLSKEMGRTKHFLCRKAKEFGLTDLNRPSTSSEKEKMSLVKKQWFANNPHPKGMLGKTHTPEVRKRLSTNLVIRNANLSEEQKEKRSRRCSELSRKYSTTSRDGKTTWKGGWREIGGKRIYFRSRWEANYGRFLEFLRLNHHIISWEHEPQTFWFEEIKRGCRSYLPDFKVIDNEGNVAFHEVKGWMDDRSKTVLNRMRIYYPEIIIILICSKEYKEISKQFSCIIEDWE